jgi:hypothetical protein
LKEKSAGWEVPVILQEGTDVKRKGELGRRSTKDGKAPGDGVG